MSRNTEYQFISTDTDTLVASLVAAYETITKTTVQPASPEKLFILWVANIVLQERVMNNYTGNQNLPSRAEGADLDALGDLFFSKDRPSAQSAICTERFYITTAQSFAVLVPVGTKVTDAENTLVWETTADVYISPGALYADAMIQCQTIGTAGNDYAAGQINTIIDPYDYCDRCENITKSDDGADTATDDEYYELMRESQDAYSDAGSKGGYIYFAKQVSTEIADVVANSRSAGYVNLYILMEDGTIAGQEMKNAVLSACTPAFVRPLNDNVVADDPETVPYDIKFTYYIPRSVSLSSSEIADQVNSAVNDYVKWQSGKLGRDINPDELRQRVKAVGVKRIVLTSPSFTALRDGSDNTVPQVALLGTKSITDGGYEDE